MKFNKYEFGIGLLNKVMNTIKPKLSSLISDANRINLIRTSPYSLNTLSFTNSNGTTSTIKLYLDRTPTTYVDQINGDDNNDGISSNTPFKSLQKALDKIPPNGLGNIIILGTYELNKVYNTGFGQIIGIYLYHNAKIKTNAFNYSDKYYGYYNIRLMYSTSLNIFLQDKNSDGEIEDVNFIKLEQPIPDFDISNKSVHRYYQGMFSYESNLGGITALSITSRLYGGSDKKIIEINNGTFFFRNGWNSDVPAISKMVLGSHYSGKIIIAKSRGAKLYDFSGSIGDMTFTYPFKNVDIDDTELTYSDMLSGIIRDVNGVPRNLLCNKVV